MNSVFSSFAEKEPLPENNIEKAIYLQNMIISRATGGDLDERDYLALRKYFMENSKTKALLPQFIRNCRSEGQLWGYLKGSAETYAARRTYIYGEFERLLEYLENEDDSPSDIAISETIISFNAEGVHHAWQKALDRRSEDPEGAITMARTLMESVCKHILEEANEKYDNDDLPKLYRKTSSILNLSPDQHSEQVFKSILGGCNTVVQGLGSLRNKIGDAHGKGRKPVKPQPRHASLAVNLAGSMATFLIETWQSKR